MAGKAKPNNEATTRRKLLEAGLRLFGLHGFEATSTRALAAAAGVNLGAILYHFGGKEGLYRAVLEGCVTRKREEIGPRMAAVRAVCADPASGREALREALRGLVATMVEVMLGNPESRAFSQIMMQEQIAPTPAYDDLYQGFFDWVHGTWALLLGRLSGLSPDCEEIKLRALSLMGQLVIFRIGMEGTLRTLGVEQLSPRHLDCIIRFGVQQMEAIVANFTPVCGEDGQ